MDQNTLSYINLFGILGALPHLCRIVPEAKQFLPNSPVSVGFAVSGGASATLTFSPQGCAISEGTAGCMIKLPFSTPEKLNAVVDGKATPIPSKGFTKIGFLTKNFTALTNLLTKYLRCSEDDLSDPIFKARSTEIMLHVVGEALSQIGNHDKVGQISASKIPDGLISLAIKNGPSVGISAKSGVLKTMHEPPTDFTSQMEFCSIDLARDLFDGKAASLSCIGRGEISMVGMISQLDNVNRILDRVAIYIG